MIVKINDIYYYESELRLLLSKAIYVYYFKPINYIYYNGKCITITIIVGLWSNKAEVSQ